MISSSVLNTGILNVFAGFTTFLWAEIPVSYNDNAASVYIPIITLYIMIRVWIYLYILLLFC